MTAHKKMICPSCSSDDIREGRFGHQVALYPVLANVSWAKKFSVGLKVHSAQAHVCANCGHVLKIFLPKYEIFKDAVKVNG